MIGRLDRWLPVSGEVAFFAAPADDVARALRAQGEHWGTPLSVERVDGEFPYVLRELEPIDGTRMLLVPGGDWTALFHGGENPDLGSEWSTVTARLGARSALASAAPNLYGRGKGANTSLQYADPAAGDDAFGLVRSISLGYAEDGWAFAADGEPQPWEDLAAYEARRPVDRFPPALVHAYLDAIGIPPLGGDGWGPGGLLVADLGTRPAAKRRSRRRRAEAAVEPGTRTIEALHEQMYGA